VKEAHLIVCAWGSHIYTRDFGTYALQRISRLTDLQPMCLKINQDGSPGHPVRLPRDLKPIPFLKAA